MQFWQLEKYGAEILKRVRIDAPDLSARVILKHVTGFSETEYLLCRRQNPSPEIIKNFCRLLMRRRKGEPLAYILAAKEFYGRNFAVFPDTLIPRPETELLVDISLNTFSGDNLLFLDACCGAGCIGLTLLSERKSWQGILLDNSIQPLKNAVLNAANLNVAPVLVYGDIFRWPFSPDIFDLVISNPPYISVEEKTEVMPEVIQYEPASALFSPNDGLAHLKGIIMGAARSLRPEGTIIIEHGYRQRGAILKLLTEFAFTNITVYDDMANLPRCVMAKKN